MSRNATKHWLVLQYTAAAIVVVNALYSTCSRNSSPSFRLGTGTAKVRKELQTRVRRVIHTNIQICSYRRTPGYTRTHIHVISLHYNTPNDVNDHCHDPFILEDIVFLLTKPKHCFTPHCLIQQHLTTQSSYIERGPTVWHACMHCLSVRIRR